MRLVLSARLDSSAGRLAASLLAASAAASLGACTRQSEAHAKVTATTAIASAPHAAPGASPSAASSKAFVVSIDGVAAGRASDSFGGNLKGNLERHGETNRHTKKRIRTSAYEPIMLTVGADMPDAMAAWVQDSWTNPGEAAHDGSIGTEDFDGQIHESLDFFDADIAEVKFPACDSTERAEGQLAIKIAPGRTQRGDGSGSASPPARHRSWVVSNFALDIDGLDTSHVLKIDSFTVTLPTDRRTPVDFPNLVVTLPKSHASTWIAWADRFLNRSQPGDGTEVSGELRLLAPDLRTVIATIRLDHVGIVRVSEPSPASRPEGSIATVTAELYVEGMQFVVNPAP